MLGDNPIKNPFLMTPDRSRRVGRAKLRWTNGIKDELRMLSVKGWRRRAFDSRV
jgi:hypothetical protein